MTVSFSSEGDVQALAAMFATGTWKLRLFTNNHTPAKADTWAGTTYTECTDADYAAITLSSGSWTIATVSSVTTGSYPQQTFTFASASGAIYGYYVTQTVSGTTYVMGAELASTGPFNVAATSTVSVTPKIVGN